MSRRRRSRAETARPVPVLDPAAVALLLAPRGADSLDDLLREIGFYDVDCHLRLALALDG